MAACCSLAGKTIIVLLLMNCICGRFTVRCDVINTNNICDYSDVIVICFFFFALDGLFLFIILDGICSY